jgi:hypothetical protein
MAPKRASWNSAREPWVQVVQHEQRLCACNCSANAHERANGILNLPEMEKSAWQAFTNDEREALSTYDYVQAL